jgi:hypothetical protein
MDRFPRIIPKATRPHHTSSALDISNEMDLWYWCK